VGLSASFSAAATGDALSIWLQLPKKPDFSLAKRVESTDAFILRLLGEGATKQVREASGENGQIVRYEAATWSSNLTVAERESALRQLMQTWGSALHIDGTPALSSVMFAQTKEPKSALMQVVAAERLLAPTLSAAGQNFLYDGSMVDAPADRPSPVFAAARPASALPPQGMPKTPLKAVIPLIEQAPPLAPAWTSPYSDLILNAARDSGISPALLRAVVEAKSKYRAKLVSGGGYGLMGVSQANAKLYGYTPKDMLDPQKNLSVGVDILAALLRQFDGDVSRALAAYQVGAFSVLKSGGIPNDKNVQDFLGAVALAEGPASRAARLPVEAIRSPLKFEVQKDLVELAQQRRNKPGIAQWRPLIVKIAERVGVDQHLMEAMIMQEDPSGDPTATSPRGAKGLGQLMPDTATRFGVTDPTNAEQNLTGMARYMKFLDGMFGGNKVLIAAAYNSGEKPVRDLGRVPRYKETMAYVRRVFDNYFTLTETRVDIEPHMPPPLPVRVAKTSPLKVKPAELIQTKAIVPSAMAPAAFEAGGPGEAAPADLNP
jgi:soluble lytic murein transglycosylase-like protein